MSLRRTIATIFRPRLERLEDRTVPTVYVVNTPVMNFTVDGQVSLLEAIQAANTNASSGDATAGNTGLDTIQFAPNLNGQTIVVPATMPSGLDIREDLTMIGPGRDQLTISGNSATRVFLVNPDTFAGVDVEFRGLTLANGVGTGGAILNQGNLTLRESILKSNSSSGNGGGIYNFGNVTIENSVMTGNSANLSFGGGIFSNNGALNISGTTIASNTSYSGGGIYMLAGTLTVTSSSIMGNRATGAFGNGAGIYGLGTTVVMNSTISGNFANNFGGGIFCDTGTLTITSSTVAGNRANSYGGGAFNFAGTLTIEQSTFSGNFAGIAGGAIGSNTTMTISNSTIAGNSTDGSGGGIMNGSSASTLTSTIVAMNRATTDHDITTGQPIRLAYTLIQQPGATPILELVPGTNLFGVDPLLGPLANNGGPTLTHAFLPGSPALDCGSNPFLFSSDQRGTGFQRVVGAAADIGAFESHDSDVRIVPDPDDRSKNVLVVVGTRKADTIGMRLDDGEIEMTFNGDYYGFDPQAFHRIVAFGMEGPDTIKSSLALPGFFDGGRGADNLTGGSVADILLGGRGADILLGGGGRDFLIGGDGADALTGGGADDILFGGRTTYEHDQDHRALALILAEWNSARSYNERRDNIFAGTGVPQLGLAQLTDGFTDTITGDAGLELFFRGTGDKLASKAAGESVLNVP